MKVVILFGLIVVGGCVLLPHSAAAERDTLATAEALLADRNYAEAVDVLETLCQKESAREDRDYLLLLLGHAQFYQQQYAAALEHYRQLVVDYPDSPWKSKALFKQADCYAALKQFEPAEAIYEREVRALVSPERKARIAGVYLKFAEDYFTGTWVERRDRPGAEPQPNYGRAKTFYELALQMELGAQQKETLRFQVARCAFELGDYSATIATLQQLLADYPDGAHHTQAQYYLGRAFLRQGSFVQARKTLRDFSELHPDDPHAAEAAFLLSRAYQMPNPGSAEALELGAAALHDFLEAYPDADRALQAEYEIGAAYYNVSRYEDAIAAFNGFIAKYDNDPEAADEYLPLTRYYLGKVYQQQRKFDDAIRVWQTYLQRHPAHKQWSDVQREIIETEYLIADRLAREKDYDAARAAWETFLNAHPLDPRNPEIMLRIGLTLAQQAEERQTPTEAEALYQQAIAQWKRAVSKYPNTDQASRAQYEIGHTLETRLHKFVEALDAYKLVTWGAYASDAQQRISAVQAKRLSVLTERVFRSNETPLLHITTRNIETLTLKMYKVDLQTYFRKMQTTEGADQLDIALIDPDLSWEDATPAYEPYREFERDVPLRFTDPGAYLVTCSDENATEGVSYEATALVLISDLDVIVKSTKRDLLVFAQNMATGRAFADVKFLVSDGRKIFFEGATGDDGAWHRALDELQDAPDVRVFAYSDTHYAATTLATGELQFVSGLDARGYLYTDRPAYRPGQRVNIRGLLREVDARGALRTPASKGRDGAYTLQVLSSQGSPMFETQVSLNDFGAFAADFTLSDSAPTGEYRLVVSRGKQTFTGEFLVETYQLDKLKLTIDTQRDVYFRGETITGAITAEYYYGEPVTAKAVSYTLAGDEVFSGVTDEQGQIEFSLDTRNFAESQTLTLTARLDDENVQTGKTVWLATRGFACDVSTIRSVYLVNEDIEVRVQTRDPAGEPIAKDLRLSVLKRETSVYGEIAEVQVDEQPVATGGDGEGRAMIRLADGGEYVLRAKGRDRFGNPVSGETELFISGQDDEIMLRFITDAEEFNVGETPEVTLFSRASKGLTLLTYEAEAILSYQIIELQPERNPLPLAIGSEHAPNFTLAVAQMDGHHFHQAQKEFAVVQGLNIAIAPQNAGAASDDDQLPEFEPGATVTVEITTTDHNGKPAPAEVSLAMVDEALYAQYADAAPPIRDYFYGQRRDLRSQTATSCTFRFDAETREIVQELLDEEQRAAAADMDDMLLESEELALQELSAPAGAAKIAAPTTVGRAVRPQAAPDMADEAAPAPAPSEPVSDGEGGGFLAALRAYFPETGYWNPSIVTDESGKANVTITLPDSTTTWRLTSRGITRETLVGQAAASLQTKLPFFVELKTPAALTEGDQATLLASIHNYFGAAQSVHTTFTGRLGDTVLERREQTVAADSGSVLEQGYRLNLSKLPHFAPLTPLSVELRASADQVQDGIKRNVPVRAWGVEYVTTKSGTLRDDRQIEIALPGNRDYRGQTLEILLNPALDRTLLDLAHDTPRPFKPPASSAIHEAIVLLNALSFVKDAPNAAADVKRLSARFNALLTDIALRQNQDGGWNWTGTEARSDLFVSADAVALLTEARRQGFAIRVEVLQQGIAYLKQGFQTADDNELKTYLLYALTVAHEVDFAHVNRVYRERNALHTAGLALLTLIYDELGRPEIAADLFGLLLDRARQSRDSSTGRPIISWNADSPYTWLQSDIETTALALLALQRANPRAAQIPAGIEWLYAQREWIGWGSMRANARVSAALLAHFSETQYAADRYVLDVAVNGTPVQTMTVDSERGARVLPIAPELLQPGENTIQFRFDGRGTLNYVCVLRGVSRDVRKQHDQYQIWRYYEPAPIVFEGQEIPRGFNVLSGSYSTWRNELRQIPLGGFGRVNLHYQRREYEDRQPYRNRRLIITEPLPAGCTVLEQSIQGGFLDYEIGDGQIVFYLNNARYGAISYDLYGYLPGEFRVLPPRLQSAYRLSEPAYGDPYALSVLARGEPVTETYRKTPDELFYLGQALFEAGRRAEARPLLAELFENFQLDPEPYKQTARMLMYIAIAERNAGDIVQYFEILKEKYPDLVLSFADIVTVGRAYRDIGEFERAVQVFKATAEASFLKDVQVSGALEGQGEFLASIDYTRDVIREYPDMPTTETSFYALAHLLYTEAGNQATGGGQPENEDMTREALLKGAIAMLRRFLVLYPEQPIADEVSFSLANAYLDLEAFAAVIPLVQRFQQRYPKSAYLSGYQYIEGYANFELERYDASLALCRTVATSTYPDKQGRLAPSDHKDLAIYIMGQIYHSMGQPDEAIAEYEKVKDLFPDAAEAIAHFTRKTLEVDEITTLVPDADGAVEYAITLRSRNVPEAQLLVYRVDLMKLYLLRKNLNTITDINLAGITPYHQATLELGTARDYAENERRVALPLETEGAYLVVAKAAELDASGMALLSVLQLDVDEDAVSGRVRVHVRNAVTGRYENKVHVKVIGTGDTKFVSGETDLRGIFIADNIHGAATVIARKGDQYAFYRGDTALQPAGQPTERPRLKAPADLRSQAVQHLRATNQAIQQQSADYLRQNLYQNKQIGVEVQAAY